MTSSNATNDSPLDKRVLIVDPNPEHRDWLTSAAKTVVAHVEQAAADVDPESGIDPKAHDLVVINIDAFERAPRMKILRMVRRWGAMSGGAKGLLVSAVKRGYDELFRELRTYGLMNLLATNEDDDSAFDVAATLRKILKNELFGVERYFQGEVQTEARKVSASSEVPELREAAIAFANKIKIHPRVVDGFGTAVEELVMNALYNAPVDAEGKQRFASTDRNEVVTMEPGQEVIVTFALNDRRLGVSVQDSFGELGVDRALQRLGKCFRMGDSQVEDKDGGAGLGLYVSFGALSQLVVNVAPQRCTEVVGLIDILRNYRDFASRAKSFNSFVEA